MLQTKQVIAQPLVQPPVFSKSSILEFVHPTYDLFMSLVGCTSFLKILKTICLHSFDKFYIDLKTEHVIFFCDNHFYMFSIEKNKVISKMTCENLDKSICHIDSNRQGNVYILMPHL